MLSVTASISKLSISSSDQSERMEIDIFQVVNLRAIAKGGLQKSIPRTQPLCYSNPKRFQNPAPIRVKPNDHLAHKLKHIYRDLRLNLSANAILGDNSINSKIKLRFISFSFTAPVSSFWIQNGYRIGLCRSILRNQP